MYAVLVAWTAWSLGLLPGLLVAMGISSAWLLFNAIAIDVVGVWNAAARFGALALLAYLAAMHRLVSAAFKTVSRLASTDVLTGALNRRALAIAVTREVARCQRERVPLSVLCFDLDRFKVLNDEMGHGAGDALLAVVTQATQDLLRTTDVLARVGGDEFVVLLRSTELDESRRIAERIRAAVEALGSRSCAVTASIGLVTWYSPPATADSLLARADHAMYEAKRNGGNRITEDSVSAKGPRRLGLRATERAW
ncbi:MAG: GGDEF domain-containing protein [Myxococcota bacterium]|nr:GGDEF domain-containing protein [Myxococcota bacterium]